MRFDRFADCLRQAAHAVAAAALLACAPAWAVIGFEDVAPSIHAGGGSFSTDGYLATVTAASLDTGLNGVVVDGGDPEACVIVDCPVGNASHYFIGVNDGGIEFASATGRRFQATSFDASFVAPVGGLPIDGPVALLRVYGFTATSHQWLETSFTLPGHNAQGAFTFAPYSLAGSSLDGVWLSSFGVYACLFDGRRCSSPAGNQAQFALDDVRLVGAVPEPSTWALMAVGGLLLVARRRRA